MKHVTFVLSLALFFIAMPVLTALADDATTFTSVRLSVDDKGAGVLTVDSRPAEETNQPESSPSEPADLKIFGKASVSKLKDGRLEVIYDFKKVAEIADVIPSFLPHRLGRLWKSNSASTVTKASSCCSPMRRSGFNSPSHGWSDRHSRCRWT